MDQKPFEIYEFSGFRLIPHEHLLLHGASAVHLPPKAFDLLVLLVRESGHLLEKKQLISSIWPDTFVEDTNLSQNIFVLRKALGAAPGGCLYIETVPKRGYRFAVPVRRVQPERGQQTAEALPNASVAPSRPRTPQSVSPTLFVAALVVAVLLTVVVLWLSGRLG